MFSVLCSEHVGQGGWMLMLHVFCVCACMWGRARERARLSVLSLFCVSKRCPLTTSHRTETPPPDLQKIPLCPGPEMALLYMFVVTSLFLCKLSCINDFPHSLNVFFMPTVSQVMKLLKAIYFSNLFHKVPASRPLTCQKRLVVKCLTISS